MISILAQERLLGFALGTVSMGGYVLHQRRAIYRSLAEAEGTVYSYQMAYTIVSSNKGLFYSVCLFGQLGGIMAFLFNMPLEMNSQKDSAELAHVWNKAVDETLGRLVVYLSSRGW